MPMDDANKSAGEVPSQGQVPASEVGQPEGGIQQSAEGAAQAPWKVKIGDTEYDDSTWKSKGVDDFKRFHGEYTRSRQELAYERTQNEAARHLLEMVRNDPELVRMVQQRLAAGQSPQQAMQGAVRQQQQQTQADPRYDQLSSRLETMEQERATDTFSGKHPDMTEEDNDYIMQWVGERKDKLRSAGWSYEEILDVAYNDLFVNRKAATLYTQGQQAKEQEIQKGKQSQLLGSPSPTAKTAPKGPKKATIHMSPAERQETAMEEWRKSAKKG